MLLAALALFGAGITASLSPCTVPLLPGYVAVVADGARSLAWFAAGVVGTEEREGAGAAALGVTISGSSTTLQRVAGAVLLVAGVAMVALHTKLGAQWLGREVSPFAGLAARLPSSPRWRGLALGVGCAAAWTPCAGPLLGAALGAALASGTAWRAGVLLAAYAAGVLAPFATIAWAGTRIVPSGWRRVGRWSGWLAPVICVVAGAALASGRFASLVSGR
jgi:cytochrome c-type biogenesis protein